MSDIYTQTLDSLTAPDQTFAFKEVLHSSGITYREFRILTIRFKSNIEPDEPYLYSGSF